MSRKLTLDVDSLTVVSFEAGDALQGRGTVEAREAKVACPWSYLNSCPFTQRTCASVEFSCLEEGAL